MPSKGLSLWTAVQAPGVRRGLGWAALAGLSVLGGAGLVWRWMPASPSDGVDSSPVAVPLAQGRVVPAPEGAPMVRPQPAPAPVQGVDAVRSEPTPRAVVLPPGDVSRPVVPPQPAVQAPLPPMPPVPQGKSYGTAAPCAVCGWVESVRFVAGEAGGLPPGALAAAGAARGVQSLGTAAANDPATVAAAASLGAAMGAGSAGLAPGRLSQGGPPVAYHEILVRLEDGSQRLLRQADPLPLGARVSLQGGAPRLLPEPPTGVARTAPAPGRGYSAGTR